MRDGLIGMRYGVKSVNDVPEPRVLGTRCNRRAMAFASRCGSALHNDLATDFLGPEERAD